MGLFFPQSPVCSRALSESLGKMNSTKKVYLSGFIRFGKIVGLSGVNTKMPHIQVLNPIEKQVLENIAATGSDEMIKRAKILLELNRGENHKNIVKKLGIAKQTVTNWKKKWTSSTITSETLEDAIAKINNNIGNLGRCDRKDK